MCPPYAALQAGRCRAADVVKTKEEEGMPAKRKDDDGPVTGVQAFAAALRAQREAVGPDPGATGRADGVFGVGHRQAGDLPDHPSPQHAAQADGAPRTPGAYRRLRQAMPNGSYKSWIRGHRSEPPFGSARTRGRWGHSRWPALLPIGIPPIWTTHWMGRSPKGPIRWRGSPFFMIHSGVWRSHLRSPQN
jgi:hypothetical protein